MRYLFKFLGSRHRQRVPPFLTTITRLCTHSVVSGQAHMISSCSILFSSFSCSIVLCSTAQGGSWTGFASCESLRLTFLSKRPTWPSKVSGKICLRSSKGSPGFFHFFWRLSHSAFDSSVICTASTWHGSIDMLCCMHTGAKVTC